MNTPSYGAAQHELLAGALAPDHERRLTMFLNGLRNDPQWTEAQVDSIEMKIRQLLSATDGNGAADNGIGNGNGQFPLSKREEEVLRLLARGYTSKEIAQRFELSAKTIETYKTRSLKKLNLQTRADIIRFALEHGWLENLRDADELRSF